jgi:hypothetical protein
MCLGWLLPANGRIHLALLHPASFARANSRHCFPFDKSLCSIDWYMTLKTMTKQQGDL